MMRSAGRKVQITFSAVQEKPCGGRCIYAPTCRSAGRACLAQAQTGTGTEAGKCEACPRKSHILHPVSLTHAYNLQRPCLRQIPFYEK